MDFKFCEGDRIEAVADGQWRIVTIEALTANQRIAQCSWTVGSTKRYVMCMLAGARRVEAPKSPDSHAGVS
jgi:hypothetical protein